MNSLGQEQQEVKKSLDWAIAFGIGLIVLGLLAILAPIFATAFATVVLAWVFLIGGVLRIVYAFQGRQGRGFLPKLLLGLLYSVLGILLLTNILEGIITLTLAVGIAIVFEGVFEVVLAFQLRPSPRWSWALFSGIVTIVLGILIWSEWPYNAPWILGLLIGVSFLFTGTWIAMLAWATRHVVAHIDEPSLLD